MYYVNNKIVTLCLCAGIFIVYMTNALYVIFPLLMSLYLLLLFG